MNEKLFIQSSIGKKIILKEEINVFKENVKYIDWTDNKIYKPAMSIEIKSSFEQNKNEKSNILSKGELLKQKIDLELKKQIKSNDFSYLKQFLLSNYPRNEEEEQIQLNNFLKALNESVEYNEENKKNLLEIKQSKDNKTQNYKKILSLISKYKNDILIKIPFQIIEEKEQENLIKYLNTNKNFPSKPIDVVKLTGNNEKQGNNFEFNLMEYNDIELSTNNRHSFTNEIKDQDYIISFLITEFKTLINDYNMTDDYCITLLISKNNNVKEAANDHFINKYKAKTLGTIYILPEGEEKRVEFNFNTDTEEIFTRVYSLCPYLDNPSLFHLGKKFEIDFSKIMIIGALNLSQNVRFIIKK